ncbi:MAG: ECF transporter S component [Promethearchaeota archaeon]|nr:MAG: ECF transporter S component [Candidatus Lokiarchaeota archaeon]
MVKIENTKEFKLVEGYYKPNNPIILSIIAIFAAIISVLTFIVPITIPATAGYINLGDIGVMITGSLFGPIVGGIAGGIGSAFTDLFLAPAYALPTLIIKGLEGFIIGLIANPRKHYHKFNYRDVIAILVGGSIMVFGYFIVELLIYGLAGALFESIFNGAIQFGLAAIATILFDITFRNNIISNLPQAFDKIFVFQ